MIVPIDPRVHQHIAEHRMIFFRLPVFGIVLLWLSLSVVGCAAQMIPLPQHLVLTHGMPELLARMRAAEPALQAYSADIRLSYRGPEGRAKMTAAVVVSRPSSLRYALYGPHGGVLNGFGMNAERVTQMDLQQSTFVVGSATPENIDALLPFAPLGFTPQQWVQMLFGVVQIPDDATWQYDAHRGSFVVQWGASTARHMRAEIAPQSSRLVALHVFEGTRLLSAVGVNAWNSQGLPKDLVIEVAQPKIALRVQFRDHDTAIQPNAQLFILTPAPGMMVQTLP